ncbi:MAG: Flp pilus assembly complex ATPase component TadA [Candidatus Omnitrophica bacterium]|nr:Flp pilus assembly complex ATPase component TadA [Candidatus Omnitrophota bacterium]
MNHLKLGEILIKQGLISEKQLQEAIEVQKREKGRIGEIFIKLGIITEEHMAEALGNQLGIPYHSSNNLELLKPQRDQELDKLIPGDFAKKNCVLPLSRHLNSLTCAVYDPLDLLLLDNLKRIAGCEINLVIATQTAIQGAINEFYFQKGTEAGSSMLDRAVESSYTEFKQEDLFSIPQEKTGDTAELSLDKLIAKAEEAPVIKLVDLIIRQAIDERASDIHIEPFENKIILRYRIDGRLYNIPPPAPHLHLPIVSRIKILAKLDIAEKRLPQDGAITAKLENRGVDIRVSTIPTVWGEKVVMRILDKGAVPLELAGLGFDARQIELLRKALSAPYGLFFVTGPTGSGKSTTLYAAVNETVDPTKNVLTVEDPVEYKIEGINQVAIKPEIGLTFATALKAFLRQDPDVIMVGEIRDLETASICVRAALTGHFVLSTLHTNDAASAITRLVDIGVQHYLLTPSLVMIMGQRLARRLCQKCKEPYEPTADQHGGIVFKSDLVYKAAGCEACKGSGYKGRVVVAEVMPVDDAIRALISKGASHAELKDMARKNGMSTIFESGIRLVEKGLTTYDEICRISVDT